MEVQLESGLVYLASTVEDIFKATNKYNLIHFGIDPTDLEDLGFEGLTFKVEHYEDEFLDDSTCSHISKNVWIKKRKGNNQEFYSVKEVSYEEHGLKVEESKRINTNDFKNFKSIAKIKFTRYSATYYEVDFFIDVCEFGPELYYSVCSIRVNKNIETIREQIKELIPKVIIPAESKILSYLLIGETKDKQERKEHHNLYKKIPKGNEKNELDEEERCYELTSMHNPLSILGLENSQVLEWIKNRFPENFFPIASDILLDGNELFTKSLNDLMDMATGDKQKSDFYRALYFTIHPIQIVDVDLKRVEKKIKNGKMNTLRKVELETYLLKHGSKVENYPQLSKQLSWIIDQEEKFLWWAYVNEFEN